MYPKPAQPPAQGPAQGPAQVPGQQAAQPAARALPTSTIHERARELARLADDLSARVTGGLARPDMLETMDALTGWAEEAVAQAEGSPVGEGLFVALIEVGKALDRYASIRSDPGPGTHGPVLRVLDSLWGPVLAEMQQPFAPAFGSPSFGFEWQLGDAKVTTRDVPSKTLLKSWKHQEAEIVRLEVDDTDLEFITSPVTTSADLDRQLQCVIAEVAALQRNGGATYYLPEPALDDVDGHELLPADFAVTVVTGHFVHGKVQATGGRRLDQLADLLLTYGGSGAAEAVANVDFYKPLGRAAQLLYLVRYYVISLTAGVNDKQGPKVLLPVMSRTDFHSGYLQLSADEQTDFRRCVDYRGAHGLFDDYRATVLMPTSQGKRDLIGGYLGPAGYRYAGPTIGAWFDSIVDGDPTTPATEPTDRDNDGDGPRGDHRDLLSPPRGYPAHRQGRHFTYAMGRFGTAGDGAMLFELRAVRKDEAYGLEDAVSLMREFAASQLADAAERLDRVKAVAADVLAGLKQQNVAPRNYLVSGDAALRKAMKDGPALELQLAQALLRMRIAG
ncbi:hypothetical protein [Streptomyces sp. IBSBF 2435]|uniref:hypothetical protein n=1 Tax=Streptomyces sp. IBSBF 2435 TaxID=2903531 RepID=UPI002FDBF527